MRTRGSSRFIAGADGRDAWPAFDGAMNEALLPLHVTVVGGHFLPGLLALILWIVLLKVFFRRCKAKQKTVGWKAAI